MTCEHGKMLTPVIKITFDIIGGGIGALQNMDVGLAGEHPVFQHHFMLEALCREHHLFTAGMM